MFDFKVQHMLYWFLFSIMISGLMNFFFSFFPSCSIQLSAIGQYAFVAIIRSNAQTRRLVSVIISSRWCPQNIHLMSSMSFHKPAYFISVKSVCKQRSVVRSRSMNWPNNNLHYLYLLTIIIPFTISVWACWIVNQMPSYGPIKIVWLPNNIYVLLCSLRVNYLYVHHTLQRITHHSKNSNLRRLVF